MVLDFDELNFRLSRTTIKEFMTFLKWVKDNTIYTNWDIDEDFISFYYKKDKNYKVYIEGPNLYGIYLREVFGQEIDIEDYKTEDWQKC